MICQSTPRMVCFGSPRAVLIHIQRDLGPYIFSTTAISQSSNLEIDALNKNTNFVRYICIVSAFIWDMPWHAWGVFGNKHFPTWIMGMTYGNDRFFWYYGMESYFGWHMSSSYILYIMSQSLRHICNLSCAKNHLLGLGLAFLHQQVMIASRDILPEGLVYQAFHATVCSKAKWQAICRELYSTHRSPQPRRGILCTTYKNYLNGAIAS